jgi:hypothetical protein
MDYIEEIAYFGNKKCLGFLGREILLGKKGSQHKMSSGGGR